MIGDTFFTKIYDIFLENLIPITFLTVDYYYYELWDNDLYKKIYLILLAYTVVCSTL